MAEYIGQNPEQEDDTVVVDFYPSLKISDFRARFTELEQVSTNAAISTALADATDKLNHHLPTIRQNFATFEDFKVQHELDDLAVERVYQRAVHHLAIVDILTTHITTSDTKDIEDRVENLQQRINTHEAEARQAISYLQETPTLLARVV